MACAQRFTTIVELLTKFERSSLVFALSFGFFRLNFLHFITLLISVVCRAFHFHNVLSSFQAYKLKILFDKKFPFGEQLVVVPVLFVVADFHDRQIVIVLLVFGIDVQEDKGGVRLPGRYDFVFVGFQHFRFFFLVLMIVQGDVAQNFFATRIRRILDFNATL